MNSSLPPSPAPNPQAGIALVLVMLVIALASILVVNMTYNSSLEIRSNLMVEQSLQAEYLMKSALNFARVLIAEDTSPEDAAQDPWGIFIDGQPLPPALMGLDQSALAISLEIRPEESKLPIRALISGDSVNIKWRDAAVRLFAQLGFEEDGEVDHTKLFDGRVFTPEEMVANLIDFMDADSEPYQADDFVSGLEDQLPEGYFPNRTVRRVSELDSIPGFTPSRMRKLLPFVTVFGNSRRVNINLAPILVLASLHEEIGPEEAESISLFRRGASGPFNDQNQRTELSQIVGDTVYSDIAPMVGVRSGWFQVIAKVQTGASTSFLRAYVSKSAAGGLPVVRMVELF